MTAGYDYDGTSNDPFHRSLNGMGSNFYDGPVPYSIIDNTVLCNDDNDGYHHRHLGGNNDLGNIDASLIAQVVPTTLVAMMIGNAVTALLFYGLGKMKNTASVIGFIPASVVAGFLTCIGYKVITVSLQNTLNVIILSTPLVNCVFFKTGNQTSCTHNNGIRLQGEVHQEPRERLRPYQRSVVTTHNCNNLRLCTLRFETSACHSGREIDSGVYCRTHRCILCYCGYHRDIYARTPRGRLVLVASKSARVADFDNGLISF